MAGPLKTDSQKKAQYWIAEIEAWEKWRNDYWRRARRIIQRYRNEPIDESVRNQTNRRGFAILWSNIQTLAPTVYAKQPTAVVTRRFRDEAPVARMASEVLERGINFTLDEGDFDARMKEGRDDYLLVGQGVAWVRYVPRFKSVELPPAGQAQTILPPPAAPGSEEAGGDVQITNSQDAAREEVLDYEEAVPDHVAFDDFLTNPARTWNEVWAVARRAFLTREECVERFGDKIGKAIPLDYDPAKSGPAQIAGAEPEQLEKGKKACIYEVWNKKTRTVCWVSKSYNERLLDERPDPLGLTNFFPCPRPLLATCSPLSILPIPDYVYYQDQAEEVDELTVRIDILSDALKVRGFYNATQEVDLNNLFNSSNNTLIPVPGFAMLKEGGGARGLVEWFPVDQVIEVLRSCVELRRQLLDDIYQLTGISDILRGDSDPSETATAQGIKAQWGGLRVRDKQKEMARYARDTIRLLGEVIAEKFSPETLEAMTGIKMFPDAMTKQQAMQQMQAMQQLAAQGAQIPPPPPEVMEMLEQPTWEEVMELLRSNAKRAFQIDIESDSTIEPDEQAAKTSMVEFATALSGLLAGALPVLQAFPKAAPIYGEIIKESSRVFRVSRPLEEVVEKVFEEVAQMPPVDPNAQEQTDPAALEAEQIKSQTEMAKLQIEQQRTQMDGELGMGDLQLRQQELQLKAAALAADPTPQGVA